MSLPPRPRALLFDWHGTLVDTHDAMCHAMEDALGRFDELGLVGRLVPEAHATAPDDAKLVRYVRVFRGLPPRVLKERRVSRTDLLEALFGEDEEAISIAHAAYDAAYEAHAGHVVPMQDGVAPLLEGLRAAGLRIGVTTNRKRVFFDRERAHLEASGLVPTFDVTVCGDDVRRRKPAPDVVLAALERLGLPPGPDIWFVGDSVTDVETAAAAGVTSIFYNGARWDGAYLARVLGRGGGRLPEVVEDLDALVDRVLDASVDDAEFHARVRAARPAVRVVRPAPEVHVEPDFLATFDAIEPPELVLFDWHATLVDTLDAMYRAVDDTLPELETLGLYDRMVPPEASRSEEDRKLVEYVRSTRKLHPKIKADRKISRTDIFEVLFGADEEAKRLAHAAFNRHYRDHFGAVEPFEPHVRDVLEALRAFGLRVGVITNRDREFFEEELRKVEGTGWAHLFDVDVCGDDAPRRKPHPDQVLLAADRAGVRPSRAIWYVGDSTTDVVAAKLAGVTAVFFNGAQWDEGWLHTIFPGNERFPHRPDVVVNDFSEFWALVLACHGRS